MRLRFALFALVLVSALAGAASLERLREFVRETQTARASFIQTVTDRNGRMVQRWTLEKPYQQILVGDGERVWVFDPDLNQVVVRRNDRALGSTPAALLAGKEDVEHAFDWKDLPPANGLDWLAAKPKDKESSFTEIRLGFNASGLAALAVTDNFGQHTLVTLFNLERNPKLAPDLFKFTPPKGADVVGE
jgi:outer membrane lipoprotein carrier protein